MQKITLDDATDMSSLSESSESETAVFSLTRVLSSWTTSSPTGSFPSETAFLALVLVETPPGILDGFFLFRPFISCAKC